MYNVSRFIGKNVFKSSISVNAQIHGLGLPETCVYA